MLLLASFEEESLKREPRHFDKLSDHRFAERI